MKVNLTETHSGEPSLYVCWGARCRHPCCVAMRTGPFVTASSMLQALPFWREVWPQVEPGESLEDSAYIMGCLLAMAGF